MSQGEERRGRREGDWVCVWRRPSSQAIYLSPKSCLQHFSFLVAKKISAAVPGNVIRGTPAGSGSIM